MPNNAAANNAANTPQPYPFRFNSAVANTALPPPPPWALLPIPPASVWPFDQLNSQVVMDLDGDFAASYEGYGPAVSSGGQSDNGS